MDESLPNIISSEDKKNSGTTDLLDINTASLRKLVQLPGVGRVLARLIIDNRPYTSLDDLSRVPGISKAKLERIKANINISALQEDVALPPIQEQVAPSASEDIVPPESLPESQPDIDSKAEPLPLPPPPEKKSQPFSHNIPVPHHFTTYQQTFLISAGVGVIVFFLSVLAVLGLLAIINHGLRFVTPVELSDLHRDTDDLRAKSESLRGDLDGLRQRLDNLEGLSGRMAALENADKEINTRLDAASTNLKDALRKVDAMNKKVDEMSTKVDGMQSIAARFSTFLDGLKNLLNPNSK